MASGYWGKILKINLNDLSYSVEEKDKYFYRTFMGGSAMASYFLLTEMEKGVDPLGPDNVLVLTTSILTGAALPGINRFTIAAKSPLSDGFGETEGDCFFGPIHLLCGGGPSDKWSEGEFLGYLVFTGRGVEWLYPPIERIHLIR